MQNKLVEQWFRLWNCLGAKGDPFRFWQDLARRYSETHRAYHTLEHIDHCLAELGISRHLALNHEAVEFALWYHDAIYDTKAEDNEEKSAKLAVKVINRASLPKYFADRVQELILATKKHNSPANDPDIQLLIDIDLAILGQNEEKFDKYEWQISEEYKNVPDEIFRTRRIEILQSFLDRSILGLQPIYSTAFFRKKYEEKARKNISRSIAHLNRR